MWISATFLFFALAVNGFIKVESAGTVNEQNRYITSTFLFFASVQTADNKEIFRFCFL